jgi:hypothetical protein
MAVATFLLLFSKSVCPLASSFIGFVNAITVLNIFVSRSPIWMDYTADICDENYVKLGSTIDH